MHSLSETCPVDQTHSQHHEQPHAHTRTMNKVKPPATLTLPHQRIGLRALYDISTTQQHLTLEQNLTPALLEPSDGFGKRVACQLHLHPRAKPPVSFSHTPCVEEG